MRFAIYGTGGVGGYFGGRLAQAGEEVVFIARGRNLEALQTNGLKVDSIKGDFTVQPVQASDDPAEVGNVDVVLVAVKAWQIPEVALAMRPLIGPDTLVVPLQNGVDAPTQMAEVIGAEHVIGGLCGLISYRTEPGHICHAGADPFINFGELDNHKSDRINKLQNTFAQTTGIKVAIPCDIQVAMWSKFLLIVSWSGLGAITRVPLGAFLGIPQTRQLLGEVMQEVFNVAHARNITLPDEIVGNTVDFMDSLPPTGTASMQRDIMEGRRSELESQTGAVVRIGREVGVETPINSFIYHTLLPQELKAMGSDMIN
jgi:2-dehydropantoate 2-reductase